MSAALPVLAVGIAVWCTYWIGWHDGYARGGQAVVDRVKGMARKGEAQR